MRSLRVRLIAGAALVAIIPLALAMLLLSRRIETMVREDAAERLDVALGGLQVELRWEGEEVAEKLRVLSGDSELKRLFLLKPSGSVDLSEYLAVRRFLLGLDFLEIADTSGTVIADGSDVVLPWARPDPDSTRRVKPIPHGSPGLVPPGLPVAASTPILYQGLPAGIVRGGLLLDSAFLERLKQSGGMELVLRDGSSRIAAATLTERESPKTPSPALPPAATSRAGVERVSVAGRSFLSRSALLQIGTPPHGSITGLVPTAPADQAIASLRITSALLGLLGLGFAIVLGFLWSSQISQPVERLAAFSRKLAQGEWDEPLTLQSVRELETLVEALDRMRRDLVTYRDRLVTSERQAAWSQMARRVAHEIKNPLTPISISVSDLKRSYEQKREDFPAILDQAVRTIAEEVDTMKRLLQEFSEFARSPEPRFAPCRLGSLLEDLRALYGREVEAGSLVLSIPGEDTTWIADAGQIRQALVNLIKNGLEAIGTGGKVTVAAVIDDLELELSVSDTGPGLSAEQQANLFLPGFTTKAEGSGLGLTIVERIVNDHGGRIRVESRPGSGTTFRIRLPRKQKE